MPSDESIVSMMGADPRPSEPGFAVKWRWRIYRDASDPSKPMRTDVVFDNWEDAANECAALNKRDAGKVHWCRIIEAAHRRL